MQTWTPPGRLRQTLSWIRQKCNATALDESGRQSRLPHFFLIGPPRTGSTWLYEVLGKCTVLPKSTKETHFFDSHFHRGLQWYQSHFRYPKGDRPMGEVAPTYFASAEARERIARLVPAAKVVCTFRHPIERVLSLYRLKRAYGLIPWGFEQALVRDPELLESSRYATQLRLWRQTLGPSQVLVTLYDDLRDRPQFYLDCLLDFIGVPRVTLSPAQMARVFGSQDFTQPRSYYCTRSATLLADWCKARRLYALVAAIKKTPMINMFLGGGPAFAELSADTRSRLYELFRPEVEELESLINRDLSAWKSETTLAQRQVSVAAIELVKGAPAALADVILNGPSIGQT